MLAVLAVFVVSEECLILEPDVNFRFERELDRDEFIAGFGGFDGSGS